MPVGFVFAIVDGGFLFRDFLLELLLPAPNGCYKSREALEAFKAQVPSWRSALKEGLLIRFYWVKALRREYSSSSG